MTNNERFFEIDFDEIYYIVDSEKLSRKKEDFDDKDDWDEYCLDNSLNGHEIVEILNNYEFTLNLLMDCQNEERQFHRKEISDCHERIMSYKMRVAKLERRLEKPYCDGLETYWGGKTSKEWIIESQRKQIEELKNFKSKYNVLSKAIELAAAELRNTEGIYLGDHDICQMITNYENDLTI